VHHCSVSVSLNLRRETLQRIAPQHIQDSAARRLPVAEALRALEELQGVFVRPEIHEPEAQARQALDIDWHVYKVILAFKSKRIEDIE
jgi:hypothetical protein